MHGDRGPGRDEPPALGGGFGASRSSGTYLPFLPALALGAAAFAFAPLGAGAAFAAAVLAAGRVAAVAPFRGAAAAAVLVRALDAGAALAPVALAAVLA